MRMIISLATAFACLTVTGCNQSKVSNNGPVAVVDLDAVAKKLGKDKQILQLVEQRQVSLNEQVVATQNSLIEQLNKKKLEFGEVSEDEANELAQLQIKANTILATTKSQAQSNLTNFQLDIVSRFRAEVKPIAMELAEKKGCRVVLSKNDSVVFAFDEAIDLTDEVTAAIQSKVASANSANSAANGSANVESSVKQASANAPAAFKK